MSISTAVMRKYHIFLSSNATFLCLLLCKTSDERGNRDDLLRFSPFDNHL